VFAASSGLLLLGMISFPVAVTAKRQKHPWLPFPNLHPNTDEAYQ